MDNLSLHAAAIAKIQALSRQILSDAELERLWQAPTASDFALLARQTRLFSGCSLDLTEARAMEEHLEQRFALQIEKIAHFYPLHYKKVFQAIRARFTVEKIKATARQTGVAQVLSAQAEWSPVAQHLLAAVQIKASDELFQLEMALDQYYFRQLYRQLRYLHEVDRKLAKGFIGRNVDLNNLRWLFRAKRYYDLPADLIYNYSMIGGSQFRSQELYELSQLSLPALEQRVLQSPYAEIMLTPAEIRPVQIDAWLLAWIKRKKAEHPLSLAVFIAYLHEWEYQLRDLCTILEGKSYDLDIRKLLIRKLV